MMIRMFPAAVRVAVSAARQDVRNVMRSLRDPRHRGARARSATSDATVRPPVTTKVVAIPEPRSDTDAVIVFAQSGVEVNVAPGQSILDVGLRHGVDLLFSCTLGGCGACMLQIVEGDVDYDDPDAICLTEDEIEDGCCLACVGRPRGRLVLEA